MSDYERYGDYDNIDDEAPRSSGGVMLLLKIITAVVCLGVVGIIAFRMILFNKYPSEVKDFYISEGFLEYYKAEGCMPSVKTQSLRSPYDDPDLGNFFCDHLYVAQDIGEVQIAVRYNTATVARIAEEKKLELSADDESCFTYHLCINYSNGKKGAEQKLVYIDVPAAELYEEQMMYRYKKLVFSGVDFEKDDKGNYPVWMRLEVLVDGEVYGMVPIYENHSEYSRFTECEIEMPEE